MAPALIVARWLARRLAAFASWHAVAGHQPRQAHAQGLMPMCWRARLHGLAPLALGLMLSLWASLSHAQGSCSTLTVTTAPALPAAISVSSPVGTTVWTGNIVMTGTGCTSSYGGPAASPTGANWWVVPFTTSPTPIATSTGAASGLTIQALGGETMSISPSTYCGGGASAYGGADYSYYRYNACAGSFSSISFTASFPAAIKVASSPGSGFMSTTRLTTTTTLGYWAGTQWSASYADPGGAAGNLAATYVGVVPKLTQDVCTVSTPNVSFSLPTVSRTSLNGAGSTAGLTRFTVTWSSCNANGGLNNTGFTGYQKWTFTPGPSSTYIANTASTPASNVFVQLLASSLSPIANGATTTISVPQSGGTVSQSFYARYISNGVAGAGGVRGVATFDMSYD